MAACGRCIVSSVASVLLYIVISSSVIHLPFASASGFDEEWQSKQMLEDLQNALKLTPNVRQAKNIVVFIGDGMGVPTLTSARILKHQLALTVDNKSLDAAERGALAFERFPHVSLIKTYSTDYQVADSAATATALFSGYKTRSTVLGKNGAAVPGNCAASLGTDTVSILELCQRAGKSTGIITTTRITHATPAALFAHSAHRNWEADHNIKDADAESPGELKHSLRNQHGPRTRSTAAGATASSGSSEKHGQQEGFPNTECAKDITRQLVEDLPGRNINVLLGGGLRTFLPLGRGGRREDNRHLTEEWLANHTVSPATSASARFLTTKQQLMAVNATETDYLLGLFADNHLPYVLDRQIVRGVENNPSKFRVEQLHAVDNITTPTLSEMTQVALPILSKNQKNGFFLMVEGGRIDHAHHDNRAGKALHETIDMDLAIETTVDFLIKTNQLSDTLIIVTADHSHTLTVAGYAARGANILGLTSQRKKKSETVESANSGNNNRSVSARSSAAMLAVNGHQPLTSTTNDSATVAAQLPPYYLTLGYANGPSGHNAVSRQANNFSVCDPREDKECRQPSLVPLSSETHGGEDVALYAIGPYAHLFHTLHEQHYVFYVMAYAACLPLLSAEQQFNNLSTLTSASSPTTTSPRDAATTSQTSVLRDSSNVPSFRSGADSSPAARILFSPLDSSSGHVGLPLIPAFRTMLDFWAKDSQCVVQLPKIFDDLLRPAVNCDICVDLVAVPVYDQLDEQTFRIKHYNTGKPCLVKNAALQQNWSATQVFSLEYFHYLYIHEIPEALQVQSDRCQFFPYKTEFTSLDDALRTLKSDERRRTGKPWYMGWSNCDLSVAEHLRQHYRRPQFFPKESTSSPIDWIFMGTPGPGAHLHVDNVGRMSWQAQIRGTKRWRLQPPRECYFKCIRELQITVEPGDIIVVDTDKWYHATQVLNENDISITIGSEFS